ncbi:hypothetical protein MLD38_010101 [Melastoma candidum]|uniref:Uncharacterized protein n=1 Tax=Melastoma candidum TaxID=119954 RepID=A0ACB9R010_9MYRT|nr:hypothetical protein MLD38_010101 [Melastoma candidum]
MYQRVTQLRALFFFVLLCLYTSSGLGAIEEGTMLLNLDKDAKPHVSSATFDDLRDAVPIVNPTTPSTTTPLVDLPPPPPPAAQVSTPLTARTSSAWCIAIPSAPLTTLQVALDYACGYGGADCTAIQPGAACYEPNTVQDHASYAFNDYYQKNPIPTSCVFGGVAQLAYADPSHGSCHFASPTSTTTTTPVTPSPVVVSPPPPIYSAPTTTVPSPPIIYGVAEPTGSPSSATSIRWSTLRVLVTTVLIGSVILAICL